LSIGVDHAPAPTALIFHFSLRPRDGRSQVLEHMTGFDSLRQIASPSANLTVHDSGDNHDQYFHIGTIDFHHIAHSDSQDSGDYAQNEILL
jgi:hypothetical protein